MTINLLQQIKKTLYVFEKNKLIQSLERVNAFHDEPPLHFYSMMANNPSAFMDYYGKPHSITGSGYSFSSKQFALLKCLSETIERCCLYSFPQKQVISAYTNLENALDIALYPRLKNNLTSKLGWVEGYNLSTQTTCMIPAQLTYIPYLRNRHEVILTDPNSSGAASGLSHEDVLLRGIYELIERDSFMSVYLGKIKPYKMPVQMLKKKSITSIVDIGKRYKLEMNVFDITNDLGVPAFATILVDKTKLGPAVSVGFRAGLHVEQAIIGSIEESFVARQFIRYEYWKRKEDAISINPKHILTLTDRGLYWSPRAMLKHLGFLFNSPKRSIPIVSYIKDTKSELVDVLKLFAKKNMNVYYVDITLDIFRKLGFYVYKMIIPSLQPLYLNEGHKEVRLDRIEAVAKHFGQTFSQINTVPHPFL